MVIGGLPVVISQLAHLLCDDLFASTVGFRDLGTLFLSGPSALVAAHSCCLLGVWYDGHTLVLARAAAESLFADIGTPGKGPSVLHALLHHAHQLIEGEVVTACPTPVVLNLQSEGGVEGLVRVTGQRDVIIGVQGEILLDE